MKYLITILFLFFHISANNNYVIGCRSGAGFFANFFVVLSHLDWCQQNNKMPIIFWDKSSLYYHANGHNGVKSNAWEYYFEPYNNLKFNTEDPINNSPIDPGLFTVRSNSIEVIYLRQYANWLIKKYIKVKPVIQNKVDDFIKKNFSNKKTVGIHLRGTDKFTEVKQVDPKSIIKFANQYKDYQFFIATDEKRLLELCKKKLNGNVIFYESTRSETDMALHVNGHIQNKALLGEEVLIECLLLSKCDILLHTFSCVSIAAHFFNPKIDAVLFRADEAPKVIKGDQ